MSSLPEIDSLSGLAAYAASVEKLLCGDEPIDQERFTRLQQELNALQVNCPNHKGVNEARVRWFELLLDSFEKQVVVPLEKGEDVNLDMTSNPLLLEADYTIEDYLKRSYLKKDFPRLYQRVISLYERIGQAGSAVKEGSLKTFIEGIVGTTSVLRQCLLEGRM